jgi:hypothetical protein
MLHHIFGEDKLRGSHLCCHHPRLNLQAAVDDARQSREQAAQLSPVLWQRL